MATYYVGSGGNDSNDGLTWANRFLTLNGAEDEPVAAGDTVYVGPGVYRETLVCDVSGTSGNPITYIGDVTGANTDGIGGIVRITGSNNDTSATRTIGINISNEDYRVFRGFRIDGCSSNGVEMPGSENNIFEDCVITNNGTGVYWDVASSTSNTIRRCIFMNNSSDGISNWNGSLQTGNPGHVIENCIFMANAPWGRGIRNSNGGGVTVRNCTLTGEYYAIWVDTTGAAAVTVNNCILVNNNEGCRGAATGDIVENYNNFWGNGTNRTNTATGANSTAYFPLFNLPLLLDGYQLPYQLLKLSEWSQIRAITGSSEPSDDFFGMPRPATASKNSWGAIQYIDMERETGTTRTGSVSLALHDAGRHQMFVPVTATSTTFSVYVYREANYAGTNPQLIVKQPGVADDTTTDAAAASQWNELTTTLTPDSGTDFVVVELVSNNTATSGSYEVFFDDFTVS